MYTVIRFSGSEERLPIIGNKVNLVSAGMYDGIDHHGGRFSCSLARQDIPQLHLAEIMSGIDKLSGVIQQAQQGGITVSIDIAIGREDYQSRSITEFAFASDMMQALAKRNIEMIISIYGSAEK